LPDLVTCATWDFRSDTAEGWESQRVLHDAWTGTTIASPAASPGSKSLALGFDNRSGPDRLNIYLQHTLCLDPINLSTRTLSGKILLEPKAGSPALQEMYGYFDIINQGTPSTSNDCSRISVTATGRWVNISCALKAATVTALGFELYIAEPWTGTIYLDDLLLQ